MVGLFKLIGVNLIKLKLIIINLTIITNMSISLYNFRSKDSANQTAMLLSSRKEPNQKKSSELHLKKLGLFWGFEYPIKPIFFLW